MKLQLFLAVTLVSANLQLTSSKASPSFDCKKAISEIDKTICGDAELTSLDQELARAYRDRYDGLLPYAADKLKTEQLAWLSARNEKCAISVGDRTLACLKHAYIERTRTLHAMNACTIQVGTFDNMICGDTALKAGRQSFEDDLFRIISFSPKENAGSIREAMQDWFVGLQRDCMLNNIHDPTLAPIAKACILDKIRKQHEAMKALSPQETPAYRLTPIESLIVHDYSESHSDLGILFWVNKPMMEKTLNRLLRRVINEKERVAEFENAISGPGQSIEYMDGRYAFGERCMRHACSYEQGGFFADTVTGEIAFALNQPNSSLNIYEMSCASEDFKKRAKARFQRTWATEDANPQIQSDETTGIVDTDCR